MSIRPNTTVKQLVVFCLVLLTFLLSTPSATAQQSGGGFRRFLQGLASMSGGSVVGGSRGAKTENDPVHGGYLNLSFAFLFAADGTYREAAYMGSRQIMFASGSYQQAGNRLVFSPQVCNFATPELGQVVRFFPIPIDSAAEETINFSPLQGGAQMSLKDAASGEDWGLKPAL